MDTHVLSALGAQAGFGACGPRRAPLQTSMQHALQSAALHSPAGDPCGFARRRPMFHSMQHAHRLAQGDRINHRPLMLSLRDAAPLASSSQACTPSPAGSDAAARSRDPNHAPSSASAALARCRPILDCSSIHAPKSDSVSEPHGALSARLKCCAARSYSPIWKALTPT